MRRGRYPISIICTTNLYGQACHPSEYTVTIWMNNAEVLSRGGNMRTGTSLKEYTVLGYDLWMVMVELQNQIQFNLIWEKEYSHIQV